jgi:hypothetical protein
MDTLTVQFLVLVPLVLGVIQVFKLAGLSTRWSPLVALILGIGGAFLIGGVHSVNVIQGLVAGLSAIGLWSGIKATATTPTLPSSFTGGAI